MMRGEAARRRGAAGRVTPREAEGTEGGGGGAFSRGCSLYSSGGRGANAATATRQPSKRGALGGRRGRQA